ncbi:MAG: PrsW family glutamic-type intramembrane protease [Pseudomonadota bacterium]
MLPLLFAGGLIPVLFWAAYHYYHDRHRPEPVAKLIFALLLGGLASLLAGLGYELLGQIGLRYDALGLAEGNRLGLFLYAFLGIGVVEELAKLLPFLLLILRFSDFDEPVDGIVYASFIGLGFAALENLYYFPHLSTPEALARGFAAPVVHRAFASIWGYRVGKAKLEGGSVLTEAAVWLLAAAFVHGVYDFIVLGFGGPALVFAAAVILAIWFWRLKLLLQLSAR